MQSSVAENNLRLTVLGVIVVFKFLYVFLFVLACGCKVVEVFC